MALVLRILKILVSIINIKTGSQSQYSSQSSGAVKPESNAPCNPAPTEKPPEKPYKAPPVIETGAPAIQFPRLPPPEVVKQGWSKAMSDCTKKLQDAWAFALPKFLAARPAYAARNDFTWRSQAFQEELYAKGRRKLADGSWEVVDPKLVVTQTLKSHHGTYPAQAFDFIIFKGKVPLWITKENEAESLPLYKEMGALIASQGVISGAIWKFKWKDWGHAQQAYEFV